MITLTTDFGDSHYVGAMRGAILTVQPEARIVDITHAVPRQDVRAGAFALLAAAPHFPVGTVHVAVVDPGVGTARRAILAECLLGTLVGPDNGLLMPAAQRMGLQRVRHLTNAALWRREVSATFQGRDVFGPVAAHLDSGVAASEAGPEIRDPVRLDFGEGRVTADGFSGEVVFVDSFGTCVTNIPASVAGLLLKEGGEAEVSWAGGSLRAPFERTFAAVEQGQPVLLIGSVGFLEIALREGSFARMSGLEPGLQVRVRPA